MTRIPEAADRRSSDAALVGAALGRDHRAFAELVARYEVLVKTIAYAITGDLGEKEEIAQETFLMAWRLLPELRDPERFRSWVCVIAHNLARRWQRKHWFRFGRGSGGFRLDRQASAEPSPLEQAISHEEEVALSEALATIPVQYRLPLVLFYVEQRSVEDIADVLDISEQNAKTRLWRGRRMLQATLLETTLPRVPFRSKQLAAAVAASIAAAMPAAPAGGSPLVRATVLTACGALCVVGYAVLKGRSPRGPRVAPDEALVAREPTVGRSRLAAVPAFPVEASAAKARVSDSPLDPGAFQILNFDFEDGALPKVFHLGHVVASPPGSPSRSCVMATVSLKYPRTYMTLMRGDDAPLFFYYDSAVLGFDYWVGDDYHDERIGIPPDPVRGDITNLSVSFWNDDKKQNYLFLPRKLTYEAWTHLELPLSTFVGGRNPTRPAEPGDPVRDVLISGGWTGGKPFYLDNIRIVSSSAAAPKVP